MRTVRLSSPEMRGQDIRDLQEVLNERLAHYKSRTRIRTNGIYDRETAHAVAVIAKAEGLEHFDGIPDVTHKILHPNLRSPAEHVREHEREKARQRAEQAAKGAQGLARIPIVAAHYIGVSENPPGSNWGNPEPAGWERNFGFDSGVPWCGCFSCSMINQAGGHVFGECGFCPAIEGYARAGTNGFVRWHSGNPHGIVEPGWAVLFNWVGGSEPEHIGIVEQLHPTFVQTIEGNTGGTNPSDGGQVARAQRPYSFVVGYAQPRI